MDQVLKSKAAVRSSVEGAGAIVSGVAPLIPYAGPILMFGREASWSVSDTIKSGADVRQMRMIPGQFYLMILDATQIHGSVHLEMLGGQGRIIGEANLQLGAEPKGATVVLAQFPY